MKYIEIKDKNIFVKGTDYKIHDLLEDVSFSANSIGVISTEEKQALYELADMVDGLFSKYYA